MGTLYFLCSLLLLSLISTSQLAKAAFNQQNYFNYFCDFFQNSGNYTANSTYATNLDKLLSKLTSNTEINYGFYNFSQGQNTNKINAIGLYRGDVKPNECRRCLIGSRSNLTQLCPNQKEAIGWFEDDLCMLRYSDRSIFGLMETDPYYVTNNVNNCTPDLSKWECSDCLSESTARIPIDFRTHLIGGRVVKPSCNMRFETSYLFFEPTPTPTGLTSTDNTSSQDIASEGN